VGGGRGEAGLTVPRSVRVGFLLIIRVALVRMLAVTAQPSSAGGSSGLGEALPFERVTECFSYLTSSQQKDRHTRVKAMQQLWDKFGFHEHPLFSLMRLILPHLDTERPQYQMKQKGIAKMYVAILAINETSEDAQTLLNWKKPSAGFQRNEQGNFPEVALSVIKGRALRRADIESPLTIGELNKLLDDLAQANGSSNKQEVLRTIYSRSTAYEQVFPPPSP
jgi:DNA ligase-4